MILLNRLNAIKRAAAVWGKGCVHGLCALSCHLSIWTSCSPAAPLIHVKMEGRPRQHGGLQRWHHTLPSPAPDPAQSYKDFCSDFLAGPTFCFSQLLGFLRPFTMDNAVSLSYFNKFIFACSPSWGVTMGIAQSVNKHIPELFMKRGNGASPVARTSSWNEIWDKSRIGPINAKFHLKKGRALSLPVEGQLWEVIQAKSSCGCFLCFVSQRNLNQGVQSSFKCVSSEYAHDISVLIKVMYSIWKSYLSRASLWKHAQGFPS